MIHVVAAVVERQDCFLVTRRPAGVHLEGLWEFPGGKIEAPESHADALSREMREELGTAVTVHELLFEVAHDYGDRTIALYFYRCTLLGTPRPLLGQEMRWVARDELKSLKFPPADDELISGLTRTASG